jgi:hypothetical protein
MKIAAAAAASSHLRMGDILQVMTLKLAFLLFFSRLTFFYSGFPARGYLARLEPIGSIGRCARQAQKDGQYHCAAVISAQP